MRKLRPYLAGMKLEMLSMLQYSTWYWAHLFTKCITVVVIYFLWSAILNSQSGAVYGFQSKEVMIGYMCMIFLISYSMNSNLMGILSNKIRQGTLSTDLIRPVSFLKMELAKEIGQEIMILVTQFLPITIVFVIMLKIPTPTSVDYWFVFICALVLGYFVLLAYSLLFSMLVFLTHNWWGLSQFSQFVMAFFSGSVMPITMMPGGLQAVAYVLPFHAMLSVPAQLFVQSESL
ncbi:MAG: ABC transporter permease, partial [Culicoidibacterales bacterium]